MTGKARRGQAGRGAVRQAWQASNLVITKRKDNQVTKDRTPMEIKWKTGSRVTAAPEDAYRILEKVRTKNNGNITPAEVVKVSKPKRSPLHNEFEWDDSVAGEQYRLDQARYIIRSIEVVREELPAVQSRAFEATVIATQTEGEKPKSVYRRTEDILADPIARSDLLASFVRDVLVLRKRYAALSELTIMWDVVESTLDRIEKSVAV